MRFSTVLGTVLALAAAAPLSAQQPPPTQPPQGMRPRMQGQMQPRMQGPMGQGMGMGMADHFGAVMAYSPRLLLNRKDQLNLTDDQVKQLETLSTDLQQSRAKADTALRAHHDKLMDLWKADRPDAAAIQNEARAGLQLRDNMAIAQLGAAAKAKALLTAEQRGFLQGWQDAHRGGFGRGMRGGAGRGMGRGIRQSPGVGPRMMRRPMMRGPGGSDR
jgi:Spy/CpxP family protein refolding chaperone